MAWFSDFPDGLFLGSGVSCFFVKLGTVDFNETVACQAVLWAVIDNLTSFQSDNPVAEFRCIINLVEGNDNRHAVALIEIAQQLHDLAGRDGVQ